MEDFTTVAKENKLSLGLVFPLEAYQGSVPKMEHQEALAKQAESLGFKALWFRDVPFNDPGFGDAGQLYDPWVYITHIMAHTKSIALATGSVILTLRHPVHIAKAAASIQNLSGGRLFLGVASGDRPSEFPAFNRRLSDKSELFRQSFGYIKKLNGHFPVHTSSYYGDLNGTIDLLPKPESHIPMLVTGHSGQSLDWIAENADGWLYYPRDFTFLQRSMTNWKTSLKKAGYGWKPYMQSLYVDLVDKKNAHPKPIHLGFQSGTEYLLAHLKRLENYGVNHVIFNLKFNQRPIDETLNELGEAILPHFN